MVQDTRLGSPRSTEELTFMLQEYQMVTHYLDRIADAYDRSLERYIALLSATLGIVFGLQQLSSSQGIEWSVAAGILSIPLMAGSIWYMGNVTPVSYTHLDVYKRQAPDLPQAEALRERLERQ